MKRDNLFLLGLTLFLTPLGGFAQVPSAGQGTSNGRDSIATVRRGTARPVRLTVAPHAHSPIAMAALPNATCSLHPEGDESQAVRLFADDEGMVRFAVNPDGESEVAAPLVLDCEAGGVAQTFPLELRSNSTPTLEMPASTEEVRKPRRNAFVQPALTGDEASTLSNEELAARGYPTRPDPKASARRTYYAPYWGTYLTTDVPGYEAEWIMERPTINGVLPDLAHYGQGSEPQAGMWNAYALLNNTSTWVPANGSNTIPISMYSGTSPNLQPLGNLLSYPAGVTCNIISLTTHCTPRYDEVLFTWNGWH